MVKLYPLQGREDIPQAYLHTPIADFIAFHNFNEPLPSYKRAELLIGMCMDNRKVLRIPDNFAYIIRTGGANLKRVELRFPTR